MDVNHKNPDVPAVLMTGLTKEYVPPLTFRDILTFDWRRQPLTAVENVDLNLFQKGVHAFVGPNGAGKTTLLKLVTGLLQPTQGRIEVLGTDTTKNPLKVRASVGYCITDSRSFFLRLSGRENLRFFGALQGFDRKERDLRVATLLESMELENVADRQVLTFSEGMKQRLAIARALLHDPGVLLLDEIGRGLDPRLRDKIYTMFRDDLVRQRGATLLMASHNLDEVATLADRVYVMSQGRILASGTNDEVTPAIREVFKEG